MTKTPVAMLGIDLGKTSCSLAGLDASGAVVLRRRMTREGVVAFVSKLPACVVAMEACCGAHLLGRLFKAQGHEVRLMSPEYVQPYVKAQKTDDRDAEAIAEAATRPTMRFVTLKSEAQLDLQVLHRARQRLVAARTRLTNQLRAVLLERGVILPNATALLAAVGDGSAFSKGRDLAAWLGLTPRQHSTGGRTKLLGISKRGDTYIRTQLIHGARAAMAHVAKTPSRPAKGYAGCSPEPIPMSWWWRSPPSWRGSPRRCCATGEALIIRPLLWPDPEPRPAQPRGRSRGLWR